MCRPQNTLYEIYEKLRSFADEMQKFLRTLLSVFRLRENSPENYLNATEGRTVGFVYKV